MKQPKYMRVYDNQGETNDRFTVVFTKKRLNKEFLYLGLNEYPYSPNGFSQHGYTKELIDRPAYSHLGKKIKWNDLNDACKKAITNTYEFLWEIPKENKNENLFVN